MSLFPEKGVKNKTKGGKPSVDEASREQEPLRGAERQAVATLTLGYLFGLHRSMAIEAFQRLWKTPVAAFMSCLMIALAFTLPVLFYLLVINVQTFGEGWEGQSKISLYLETEIKADRKQALQTTLSKLPEVKEVLHISSDEGLQSFQSQVGIKGVISELGFNPLPAILQITLSPELSYSELESMSGRLAKMPGVEQVRLDKKWVQRLLAITELLKQAVWVLAILLGLTIWLAISNTVGLSIEARKVEIQVVKLVGGSDGFIMLPFLYTGVIYGMIGALLAYLVTWGVLISLVPAVESLLGLYGSSSQLHGPGFFMFITLVFSGVLLGGLGAFVGCIRHLRNNAFS